MSDNNTETTNNNKDELISQFMSFTGMSDVDKAATYLEMSGNNVETAVGLFLEHEPGTSASHTSSSTSGGYVNVGDDDVMDNTSRRSGRSRNNNNNNNNNRMMTDEDGVRAPDRTRTMRLMDDDTQHRGGMLMASNLASIMMGHNPSYDLMTAMMDEQQQQDLMMQQHQQQHPPSAFASAAATITSINARALLDAAIARQGQHGIDVSRMEEKENNNDDIDDEYAYDNDDEDDEEDEMNRRTRPIEPPRLSDMFAPPIHLIHRAGGFQGARAMAKDTKRWLLVNIQRDAEFACHALNRDVWHDELIENLIREGFIFWQQV
jgi:UBX domain-containing protein 7